MFKEVVAAGAIKHVGHFGSQIREQRYFEWRGRRYFSASSNDYDFALLVVTANPFNPKKRLVVLAGLRSIGTLGAALAYSKPEFADLRATISKEANQNGEVEVVLKVEHADELVVKNVTIACREDGDDSATENLLTSPLTQLRALHKVYLSLKSDPRRIFVSDYLYTITYTKDFDVLFYQEFTLGFGTHDVVIQGRIFSSDVALANVEDLEFSMETFPGTTGEISYVVASNAPREKEFLYFPMPSIKEGDTPRRYIVRAKWPGAGRKLRSSVQPDRTEVIIPSQLHGKLDRIRIALHFKIPGAKFKVTPHFATPRPVEYGENKPFEYEEGNVNGGTRYAFDVDRLPEQ